MTELTHHYFDFFVDLSQHFLACNCNPFKDMTRSIVNRCRCPHEVYVGETTYVILRECKISTTENLPWER